MIIVLKLKSQNNHYFIKFSQSAIGQLTVPNQNIEFFHFVLKLELLTNKMVKNLN